MTKVSVLQDTEEKNPGSKLKTAVTKNWINCKRESFRRKSFCARSAGQMKRFQSTAKILTQD